VLRVDLVVAVLLVVDLRPVLTTAVVAAGLGRGGEDAGRQALAVDMVDNA
jgi:hypothetical protein